MSTQSVPHLKEQAVAETKKAAEKTETKAAPAKLARASESGDAGVQNLLALRGIHASNGDSAKVADVDRQLAELGYTV